MSNLGLHRNRQTLTADELLESADHIWLNAFLCINPTDEFAADVGRTVIAKVMQSDLKTQPVGRYDGSRAAVFWVNAS